MKPLSLIINDFHVLQFGYARSVVEHEGEFYIVDNSYIMNVEKSGVII